MGLILRPLSERVITGFLIVWIASHQSQIADSENPLPTIVLFVFLLFPITWAKEALGKLTIIQYAWVKTFLAILLEFASTGILWILISIISNLYTESLKPFANLDAMYRTIVGIIIVVGTVTMIEESSHAPALKVE
jgi:hypothetical protein